MSSGRVNWEELTSGAFLSEIFGVPYSVIDGVYVGDSLVDLAFRDESGRVHAVEVTRYEDQKYVEWSKAIARGVWSIPDLDFGWHLSVEPTSRIKDLQKRVGPLLADLERSNIHQVSANDPRNPHGRPFADIGVTSATVLRNQEAGFVQLGESARGTFVSIDSVVNVIRDPNVMGNSSKLLKTNADVKDLVVWVGYSRLAEALAMSEPGLPNESPEHLDGIDQVWLVSPTQPLRLITYTRERWSEPKIDLDISCVQDPPAELGLWNDLYPNTLGRTR